MSASPDRSRPISTHHLEASGVAVVMSCSRLHATRHWLDRIVIGQRLCPFAPPVRSPPHLNLLISHAEESNEIVHEVASAATALRKGIDNHNYSSTTQASSFATTAAVGETTLIVLKEVIDRQSLSWRDLISLSWRLQEEAIVEGGHGSFMQLVLFHPNATHNTYVDEGAPSDAGDYTIRSPYPTVQLLRECDILAAVQSYPNVGHIPSRNRARLRAQGLAACEERLRGCRSFSSSSNSSHQTMIGRRLFLSTNVVTPFRVPLTIADMHLRHEHLPFLYVFRSTLDQTKLISSLIEVIKRYPILGATVDLHSNDAYNRRRMPALECNVGNTVPMSFGTSDMTLEEWRREKRSGRVQHANWRGGGGAPRISSLFDDLSPTRWDEGDEGERKVDLVSTVRITYFKDYGTAVGINISHLLGDANSCFRFCQVRGSSEDV